MVQRIFKLQKSTTSATGWEIVDQDSGKVLDLPSIVVDTLNEGKYIRANQMLDMIDTMQIALAGVTDSLNLSPDLDQARAEIYLDRNSVLKTFGLKKNGTIDDTIDFYLTSVKEYEKYHTLKMDRDVSGDDSTIHAYIEVPNVGKIRSRFSKQDGIRLDSKRNNIDYWVADYKVVTGSQGGKSISPIGTPIEINK